MSSATLYRLSGVGLLLGSILGIVGAVLGIFGGDVTSTLAVTGAIVSFVGATLGIMGLPGMYAKQAQRAGALGLIGTALLIVYILILGAFGNAVSAVILPFIATHAPSLVNTTPAGLGLFFTLGSLFGVIGGTLLGSATIRAAVLPRWAGIAIIVGVVVQFAGDLVNAPIANLGFLFVMIGLIGLGSALVSGQERSGISSEVSASAVR